MNLRSNIDISVIFSNIPVFLSLTEIDKKLLVQNCQFEEFDTGLNIIEQGDNSTTVYFLIKGAVHVLDYSESGRTITYAALKEGDMFGEMAAIDNLPRSAWVRTITPCTVATVPGKILLEVLKNNAAVSLAILKQLSNRIRLSDERLTDVSFLGAEQRACIELMRMAKPDPLESETFIIFQMPTQSNFANIIGSSRETVSRIFKKLKEESIINISGRRVSIPNRKKLEKRFFEV